MYTVLCVQMTLPDTFSAWRDISLFLQGMVVVKADAARGHP